MAKMSIIFDGFADMAQMLDRADGDLKTAVDEALKETTEIVQSNVNRAAVKYASKPGPKGYTTGKMYASILPGGAVKWAGSVATVNTGFNLQAPGGYHSIFIMYGTPRYAKDSAVYNAIKGARTRREIAEKQSKVMEKYLKLGG